MYFNDEEEEDDDDIIDLEDLDDLDDLDDFEILDDEEDDELEEDELEDDEEEYEDEDELEDEEEYENEDELEEDDEEYEDEDELEEDEDEDELEDEEEYENEENTQSEQDKDLEKLSNLEVEYIFLGLLLNNPKAISRYYFLYDECHFSDKELDNMYRIIVFRESEQYAPAIAKEKFKLPMEEGNSYSLKSHLQDLAKEQDYDIELIYTILKKLFILKKYYLLAPTKLIRENILNIINYKLYNEMTIEEVENAIEQIGVTASLSQGRLNENATSFLLSDESILKNGANLPFPILSNDFKGLRKGETFAFAMPSNSGKSM